MSEVEIPRDNCTIIHLLVSVFVISGGILPEGIPLEGSSKLLCQRFSKESVLSKTLGYKEDYYATVYDTFRRMPVISMATVQSLGDEKWPHVPYMIEQGNTIYCANYQ